MESALFTDFYSLTMAQGYWKRGMNRRVVFEMFFRRQPFDGGFSIFAGLGTLVERIQGYTFFPEDIAYLKGLAIFDDSFLAYLAGFRFTGSLWAMDEGTVIFPQEPLIRLEGNLIECQILEGLILNIINFQSLIATKTARVWLAAGKGPVMEFGLRRAQGFDGAMSASRAAFIGGAYGTSNVLAGKTYGIPVLGTMAHSWIMSHPSEEEAFQAYADLYPENTVFLIDTYDTLRSGVPNAITVGKRLAAAGKNFGVRLDSGDIQFLSTEVRKLLDAAGFPNATISVSNDLDESIIQTLTNGGAPVNSWGVGTRMVTGGTEAAFTGVYKLTAKCTGPDSAATGSAGAWTPAMKVSDNPEKTTTPGIKQVWRVRTSAGSALADVLSLDRVDGAPTGDELEPGKQYVVWHPSADYRHVSLLVEHAEPLLKPCIITGNLTGPLPSLQAIRDRVAQGLDALDPRYKRLLNPHIYKVSITTCLRDLKLELIKSNLRAIDSSES